MGADIATFIVGPEKHKFIVHSAKLCSRIDYFRKMFLGGFQEATTSTATFPEDDKDSFDVLLKWGYSGQSHLSHSIRG